MILLRFFFFCVVVQKFEKSCLQKKRCPLINIYKLFNGMVLNHHGQFNYLPPISDLIVKFFRYSSQHHVGTQLNVVSQYRQHRFWLFYKDESLGSATNNNNWNIVCCKLLQVTLQPLISNTLLSEKRPCWINCLLLASHTL